MFGEQTRIGLGTYSLTGDEGREIIEAAIDEGYKHIDTARLYGNEREVGRAIHGADVRRDDILVATKIAHFEEPKKTPSYIRTAVEESFTYLDIDQIDLLYHHWPRTQDEVETVLPVIEEYVETGAVSNLGVSNYTINDIQLARTVIDVPIVANQVEMHPLLQQSEMRDFLSDRDIELVAYSPLAQGEVFEVDVISEVAEKHGVSEAVVSLSWLLSKNAVVIPRSSHLGHLRDNLRAFDLKLDRDEIAKIDAIEEIHRCEDPQWMTWG